MHFIRRTFNRNYKKFIPRSSLSKSFTFFIQKESRFSHPFLSSEQVNGKGCFKMSFSSLHSSNNHSKKNPTAGIIIIGDEILKGKTKDVNIHFLTSKLYHLGVQVLKVSVIPDKLEEIAEEVSLFSKKYTFVLTTGGVGPTHDDITFEAVASAFGAKLHYHPVIVDLVKRWFKTDDMNSPAMKLAHIPENAVLNFGEDKVKGIKSMYPIVTVKNVTLFPGIPHLITRSFDLIGKKLFHIEGSGFYSSELYLSCDEVSVASVLNSIVEEHKQVTFGSYPELFHSYYRTKITMEALDQTDIGKAEQALKAKIDPENVVNYILDTVTNPFPYINHLKESNSVLKVYIKEAQGILEDCFNKYSLEEICLCYNGGKDCLVVLHLTYSLMLQLGIKKPIQAVYVTEENSFPQVHEFVQDSTNRYNLDCEIISGPMKPAFAALLNKKKSIKAVIMGTRRADPHGESLQFFSPTDGDWPPMMRVSPIINWEYNHVWSFIRGLYLPYCSLYDRGYTSLGGQDNTVPNPALQTTDRLGRVSFLPAYMLKDNELERKGRIKGTL